MRMPLVAALVFVGALAGCNTATPADGTPSPTFASTPLTTPAPTTAPTTGPTDAPTPTPTASAAAIDPDIAVVRIEQVGGMLPISMTLQFYPTVALYGDGRLILEGPQIEIYPGPALPNLLVTHVSQRGVEQVLAWAAEAGMVGEDRTLGEPLLDSGVTQFTITGPGGSHRTAVTNFDEADPPIAATKQFMELMQNLRQWLPDDIASDETAYEWDRLRIISSPADPTVVADPELVSELDWPLADLATLGESLSEPAQYRCFVVEGDDLATLRPMVAQANQLTWWNSGSEAYQLQLHPLLPDDEDCPAF